MFSLKYPYKVNENRQQCFLLNYPVADSKIESVAVVAGSGASVLRGVKADLYVTGEMLHHDLLEANHCGTSVLLIDHSDSERGYLTHFAPILADHFANNLDVVIAKTDVDPILIVQC